MGALVVALALSLGVLAVVVRGGSSPSSFDGAAAPPPATAAQAPPPVAVSATLATGLTSPWGLAFLPDGSALVSERDTGLIKRIGASGGDPVVLGAVEGSVPSGEGGLLGLAVPAGPDPTFVLAYTTTETDNRIVRIAWDGEALGQQSAILTGIPKNTYHDGGRLLPHRTAPSSWAPAMPGPPTSHRMRPAWRARSCASLPTARPLRVTRIPALRSTRSAIAMCRAWPSTAPDGCGRASSARTMRTS